MLTGNIVFIKKHLSFNATTRLNDIAMLYLTSDVALNSYIQPACLPPSSSSSYPGTNVDVFTAGWGYLNSDNATLPNLLYNVKLSTYPASQCPYSIFNDALMICAGKYLSHSN